jgi:hypothetical protein
MRLQHGKSGLGDSSRRSRIRHRASTTTASSTGLAGQAARVTARDGRARRARASVAGWVSAIGVSDGTGWARGIWTGRPPRWRRLAAGGRRDGCAHSSCMRVIVRNEMLLCFFFRKPHRTRGGADETCWVRSLSKPGNEPFGRKTPGRTTCASIIVCVKSDSPSVEQAVCGIYLFNLAKPFYCSYL